MPNTSTDFAVGLLGEFVRRGVRDIVLCPGSRSQALALAAAAFEHAGLLRLRVRIDERSAGFLALGIAIETGTPVLLVTTSGTAVANLHPAVLEAHHAGVPLILLTADRPTELRGIGSNQTTKQVGMFDTAVGWLRDVEVPHVGGFDPALPSQLAHESFSAAAGHSSTPGPVQLNLAFREPLSGPVGELPSLEPHVWPSQAAAGTELRQSPETVVIAGAGAGPEAEQVARELGAPLLAEVTSGARFGPNLVAAYRELLGAEDFGDRVSRAVVYGHPTLSREIPALLLRPDVEVVVVRGTAAEAYNPGHRARVVTGPIAVEGALDDSREARAWLGSWVHASRALLEPSKPVELGKPVEPGKPVELVETSRSSQAGSRQARPADGALAREQLAAYRAPVSRRGLVEMVWRATWPHDRLVFGASRLIRVADAVLPGKRIPAHANRGLAGIDGTIATGVGIALASQAGPAANGITRVLIGDLTALHDVGSLLFGVGETRPRIQVIVGNDGGGTIFDDLEVAASAASAAFDRVQFTPQEARFEALAAAYGWEYRRAGNTGELDEALAASDAPRLIEVPLPRA